MYATESTRIQQNAISTTVVDTTAAGDTFTGYFFASILSGKEPATALLKTQLR